MFTFVAAAVLSPERERRYGGGQRKPRTFCAQKWPPTAFRALGLTGPLHRCGWLWSGCRLVDKVRRFKFLPESGGDGR